MGRAEVLTLVLALTLLYGCAQGQMPQQCAAKQGGYLANCVYVNAVMEQNPFYCYSLSVMGQRVECLTDATDPAMKKRLENLKQDERDAIFMPESEVQPASFPGQLPTIKPKPGQIPSGEGGYAATGGTADQPSPDEALYNAAVEGNDLQLCLQISSSEAVKSCISQIARQTKRPELCKTLKDKNLSELCNLYSLGDREG
jgi:hypothetical protein